MKPSSRGKRGRSTMTKPSRTTLPHKTASVNKPKKVHNHSRRTFSSPLAQSLLNQTSPNTTGPTMRSRAPGPAPTQRNGPPSGFIQQPHSHSTPTLITTTRRAIATTILTKFLKSPLKSLLNSTSSPLSTASASFPTPLTATTHRNRRQFSTSSSGNSTPFTAQQMERFQDLVDKEAGTADGFFDNDNEESDGPMTEPEDLHQYTRDFDQDNIKPELFNPQTHLNEYMVATLLQGEIDKGVPMFPIYLRGPVFRKIISTFDRITRSGNELDPEIITRILGDVFTTYAPEICRTHEHALNILFPMAPRLGDVVQLPSVTGHSIVSKREYVDNRDGFDDDTAKNMKENDDEDVGRFMVITYECLHPTLRGKSFVSKHPFDLEVYGLTMSRDEKGIERLMHERGMIDLYSGRIVNVLEQAGKIPGLSGAGSQPLMVQQRADKDSNQLHRISESPEIERNKHMKVIDKFNGPKPLDVRPQELIAPAGQQLMIPGPGDLDGKPQLEGGAQQQLIGSSTTPQQITSNTQSTHSSHGSVPATMSTPGQLYAQPQYTVKVTDPTDYLPKDQKLYYQNLVLTGDKAAFMYRQLVQELTQGKSKFDQKSVTQKSNLESLKQQARGKVTMEDIKNHGAVNARQGAKGALYGPDAFANFDGGFGNDNVIDVGAGSSYSTHFGGANITTSATTPNQVMSIKQQQHLDRKIEEGLDEVVAASSGSSKYFKQYKEMKQLQREQLKENIKNQETKTFGELHAEKEKEMNRIEHLKDKFNALIQYHVDNGKSLEEAQVLADSQFDPETGEIDLDAKIGDGDQSHEQHDHSQLPQHLQNPKKNTEPDTNSLEFDAQAAFTALPENYKKKYKHIIIKDGPGAGLPDPLAIDFGEDLFEIYPQANIALMDFLSDQWSLMVKEKQEQIQLDANREVQKEDSIREREKKQREYLQIHPGSKLDENNQIIDKNGNIIELSEDDEHNAARNRFLNESNEHDTNRMVLPKDVEATRYRLLAAVAAAGQYAFTADYVSELFERVGRYEKDSAKEKQERYVPMKVSGDDLSFDPMPQPPTTTTTTTQDQSQPQAQQPTTKKRNLEFEPDFQYLVQQQEFKRKQREKQEAMENGQTDLNDPVEAEIHDMEVVPPYVPPSTSTSVSITPEGYVKHGDKLLTQMEYAEQIFGKKPIPIEKSNVVPSKMKQMIVDHHRYRDELEKKKSMANATERLTAPQTAGLGMGQKRRFGTTAHHHHQPQPPQLQAARTAPQTLSLRFQMLSKSSRLENALDRELDSQSYQHRAQQQHKDHQFGTKSATIGIELLKKRNLVFTSKPNPNLKI